MLGHGPKEQRRRDWRHRKKLRSGEYLFLYRLAAELGIWDVESLADRMSLEQFKAWVAYYRLECFGNDWRRTARLAVTIAKALGAKVTADAEEMFLPTFDPSRPTQTEGEMMAELLRIPGAAEWMARQKSETETDGNDR